VIALGPIDISNGKLYRSWRNNPKIYDWCRQRFEISDSDQNKWFIKINEDPTIRMFEILADGYPVGVCGFTDIDMYNRRAEFSLYIAPENHKQGFGKQSLLTLLAVGFNDFGFNRIWGETFKGNPAMSLFMSVGMERDGIRKQFYYKNGQFIDAHLISIGREKWDGITQS